MLNSFKPEDKVRTKFKGAEVEATVRLVWGPEVQVRTPDGVLRWRTAKTVWPSTNAAPASETGAHLPPEGPAANPTGGVEASVQAPEATPAPIDAEHTKPVPAVDVQPATQEAQDDTQGEASVQPKTDVIACGATDEQPKAKGNRKARRHRK